MHHRRKFVSEVFEGHCQAGRRLAHQRGVPSVQAIRELYDAALRVANVFHVGVVEVLHDLHHATLYVPGEGRLYCSINETLAASHRVEEKFVGCQARTVGTANKPICAVR